MNNEYWLIYYQWRRVGTPGWTGANTVYNGNIGNWMLETMNQHEEWVFMGAAPISKESFSELKNIL